MKIKTYRVNNLTEALSKIKRDLGPEAVVLSTQRIPKEGPWYAKKKEILEVRAALDPNPSILNERTQLKSERELGAQHINQVAEDLIGPIRAELKQLRSMIQAQQKNQFIPQSMSRLRDETEEKGVIYSLIQNGVNLQAVQQLSQYLGKVDPENNNTETFSAEWLYENIQFADMNAFFNSKYILLVGPTGSGKTTTIAKLAAQLRIQFERNIALVNLDQYRVGASEQLEKYASILQVPFFNVGSKKELISLKDQFAQFDHVLLDTTGRSPYDQEGLLEIADYFQEEKESLWTSLTVPVSLRETDLKDVLNHFSVFSYNNLILTKLDETSSHGNLFNAAYFSGSPLSFFTMGQNVPDDIEVANIEIILSSLFDQGESATQIMNMNQEYLQAKFLGGTRL